jgi:hypothetical protein
VDQRPICGAPPHPLIGQPTFRIGGTGTAEEEWPAIQTGVREVRAAAETYLQEVGDTALDHRVPYDGSFAPVRQTGLSLRYALLRISAHHYFHIGEIATKRARLGHDVGDYPGLLAECI